jgi:hypothetical protein
MAQTLYPGMVVQINPKFKKHKELAYAFGILSYLTPNGWVIEVPIPGLVSGKATYVDYTVPEKDFQVVGGIAKWVRDVQIPQMPVRR